MPKLRNVFARKWTSLLPCVAVQSHVTRDIIVIRSILRSRPALGGISLGFAIAHPCALASFLLEPPASPPTLSTEEENTASADDCGTPATHEKPSLART